MYTEEQHIAAPYRLRMWKEAKAYVRSLRNDADARRADYFAPDYSSVEAYEKSTASFRGDLMCMLGRPLTELPSVAPGKAERILLEETEDGRVERLLVECAPGVWSYGLLYTPRSEGTKPYVTVLHGGLGTPETVMSVYGSANYNDLGQRIRKATGAIVYAPQLILWGEGLNVSGEEKQDHAALDCSLKQVGGSMAAYEIFKIIRTVDWICEKLPVDTDHMGIAGLSYGGFYSLFTAACDTRYRAVLSSGFFNDRYAYCWTDWHWFDSASKFLDAEIAGLVAPRALCIEVGERDGLFDIEKAKAEGRRAAAVYEKLGIPGQYRFAAHPGTHEVCRTDENIAWFAEKLMHGRGE